MSTEKTVDVYIVPEIIVTDDDLQDLEIDQRMCYMDNERKLKFFKVYTQKNCEIECLSEKLLKTCGCVPYDVIRDNDTKICELFDYVCVDRIKEDEAFMDLKEKHCKCLQLCNFVTYHFEFVETRHSEESDEKIVRIGFKDTEFASLKRVRQFTYDDFLSHIGELLGLFTGISVLSLFEIFYFLTLRLISEIFRTQRERGRVEVGSFMKVAPISVELNFV